VELWRSGRGGVAAWFRVRRVSTIFRNSHAAMCTGLPLRTRSAVFTTIAVPELTPLLMPDVPTGARPPLVENYGERGLARQCGSEPRRRAQGDQGWLLRGRRPVCPQPTEASRLRRRWARIC